MKFESSSNNQLPSTFVKMPKHHTGPIYALKFNYTGQYVMSASQDRSVSLYNPGKNILIKSYKNLHNYDISCLQITKDNSKFCTGGGDKLIMVMDVLQGKQIRKYTGHHGRVNGLCYGPNQNIIVRKYSLDNLQVSCSYDTTIKCWDNRSNSYSPVETIKAFKDSVSNVVSTQWEIIASSMDGTVKFFDVRKGQITQDKIKQPIQRMAVSFSDTAYAMSTAQNKIILCQRVSGKRLNEYTGHNVGNFTVDLSFSKHDNYILTGSTDGKLYIYDLMRKTPLKTLQAHQKTLSAMSLHQNAGLVTGGHDGTICYYKI